MHPSHGYRSVPASFKVKTPYGSFFMCDDCAVHTAHERNLLGFRPTIEGEHHCNCEHTRHFEPRTAADTTNTIHGGEQ